MDDAPGNCAACCKHHRNTQAGREEAWKFQAKQIVSRGLPLPVKPSFDPAPPCRRCPKFALYPDNWGLDPRNMLAVKLYGISAGDERVGTMIGALLLRRLTIQSAVAVLDEYRQFFPTWLERQRTLELMVALDRVVTEVRQEEEDRQRPKPKDG